MNHPYSGAASYMYANEYMAHESRPAPQAYYYRAQWTPVVSPNTSMPPVSAMGSPKNRFQISVPNLPSNLTSDRYKKFSASFSLRSSQQPAISQEYTYESMRVRFDTPDPYVVTWKREVKAIKRRFIDFRRRLAEIFTRNWITSTRPRLSMVGH